MDENEREREKNNNNNDDDRHIKEKTEQIILSIFSSFFPLFLSSFLLFRVVAHTHIQKKNEAKKKKEAAAVTHRPTSLSTTPSYAKLSPSCFAIRSLTYILYKYIFIDCVFFVVVVETQDFFLLITYFNISFRFILIKHL